MPIPLAIAPEMQLLAMAIPSVVGVVGSLFSAHETRVQQEELRKQNEASQAENQQFMAPYLQNSQDMLARAQQMAFGMTQATMGNGLNPGMYMQGQGAPGLAAQFPAFLGGYPK